VPLPVPDSSHLTVETETGADAYRSCRCRYRCRCGCRHLPPLPLAVADADTVAAAKPLNGKENQPQRAQRTQREEGLLFKVLSKGRARREEEEIQAEGSKGSKGPFINLLCLRPLFRKDEEKKLVIRKSGMQEWKKTRLLSAT